MPYQEISATVTDQNMQAVKDAITAVQTALPFLISLTEAERKQLHKTGASRLSFVQNAAQAAQDNPNILPASFDEDGFQSNVALFTAMTEINTLVAQLASQIDDTHLAVGVEALSGASDERERSYGEHSRRSEQQARCPDERERSSKERAD